MKSKYPEDMLKLFRCNWVFRRHSRICEEVGFLVNKLFCFVNNTVGTRRIPLFKRFGISSGGDWWWVIFYHLEPEHFEYKRVSSIVEHDIFISDWWRNAVWIRPNAVPSKRCRHFPFPELSIERSIFMRCTGQTKRRRPVGRGSPRTLECFWLLSITS